MAADPLPAVPSTTLPTAHLFPLAFSSLQELGATLDGLLLKIDRSTCHELLSNSWETYLGGQPANHTLVLRAASLDELGNEIHVFRRTCEACWSSGREWKTPLGSYMTPKPLGAAGKVAFVYPGIGSLYPGYTRDILDVHASAFDNLPAVPRDELVSMLHVDHLWPRDESPLRPAANVANDQWPLYRDIVAQAESTVSLAYVWTHLLQDLFQICPQVALGYSLGELAMFASCGCWNRPQELAERFRQWPSFRQRLGGEMAVLRDTPVTQGLTDDQWIACVVTVTRPASEICEEIQPPVYVTHINTQNEIVIAGESRSVTEWLERNGVRSQPVPSKLVYHCSAVAPEAQTLQSLFELPVAKRPEVDFVGMAPFARIPHASALIAKTLTNTAMHTVDFPQIVQTAHQRGARIFIEIGPRNSCTSWIRTILSGHPHIATSTDQKGFDSVTSLTRMLAVLLSHNVPLSREGIWNWTRKLAQVGSRAV